MLRFNAVNFLNIAASFLTTITVDYCVILQLSLIQDRIFIWKNEFSRDQFCVILSLRQSFARFTSQLYGFTASRFYVVSLQLNVYEEHTTQSALYWFILASKYIYIYFGIHRYVDIRTCVLTRIFECECFPVSRLSVEP